MGLRNLFVGGFELVLQLCKRLCCAHSLAKFYLTDAEPRGALRDVVGFEELSIGKNTLDGVLFLSIVKEFHSFFWGGGGVWGLCVVLVSCQAPDNIDVGLYVVECGVGLGVLL